MMVAVSLICLPLFMLSFVKMVYHYCKLIRGIKREVYTRGYFLLGPFLLGNKSFFDESVLSDRINFIRYSKRALLLFITMLMLMLLVYVIRDMST